MFGTKKKERRASISSSNSNSNLSNSNNNNNNNNSVIYPGSVNTGSLYSMEPPLPSNWEARIDPRGRKYYVDHTTKSTSWFHPLLPQPVLLASPSPQQMHMQPIQQQQKGLNSSITSPPTTKGLSEAALEELRKNEKKEKEELKRKMDGLSLNAETISQWEALIEKSEERKIRIAEFKSINTDLEEKLKKKSEKISALNEKNAMLEKRANLIKGIGLEQLEYKDLKNFITDLDNTLIVARQREIYLKEKIQTSGQNECKICFERETDTVLLECGHQCCCMECSKFLKNCPICRSNIVRVVPIFKV